MAQIQPFIDTNLSRSSSRSGTSSFPVNSELNDLASQVASLLNIWSITQYLGSNYGTFEVPISKS
jgi:hypothetical protein